MQSVTTVSLLRPKRTRAPALGGALLLAPALLSSGCVTTGGTDAGPGFTAMTYNVFVDRPECATGARVIRAADADIVFLQEVTTPWHPTFAALRDVYPYQYSSGDADGSGNALLSRFPLTGVRHLPPRAGWYGGWYAVVRTPVGPVQVLGVHLMPPLTEKERFTFGALLKTGPVHRREIESFCRAVDLDAPLIILGDFNENAQGAAGGWLHRRGLRCALSRFDWFTPTWAWVELPLVNGRLDHIYHTDHLRPARSAVINDGVSDHRPVIATFHATERLTPEVQARLHVRAAVARAELPATLPVYTASPGTVSDSAAHLARAPAPARGEATALDARAGDPPRLVGASTAARSAQPDLPPALSN